MKKLLALGLSLMLALVVCACTKQPIESSSDNHSSTQNSVHSSAKQTSALTGSGESGEKQSGEAQSSTQSSSSISGGGDNPLYPTVLDYSGELSAYLDGATINDEAFISYVKTLGEYKNASSDELSQNAIFAYNGTKDGDGKRATPYTLTTALEEVAAGQTLYLLGGTYDPKNADGYTISAKGNASNYITIRNAPGEKVIITNSTVGSEAYAFQVGESAAYTVIEGLEIANINALCSYGIVFWGNGQNHIVLRNLNIHDIKTSTKKPETDDNAGANAILLFGEGKNAISNIMIYNNVCANNVTGWSETLSVTANCEYVYVIKNRVENNTNIGIDFYGNNSNGYCSTPSLNQPRYCVAAGNYISKCVCTYADSAGLYVDGARDILLQNNYIRESGYGIEIGSEELQASYPVKNILVRNNVCEKNKAVGLRIGGYDTKICGMVTSTTIINNTLIDNTEGDANSAEIIISMVDGVSFINNIITNRQSELIATDMPSAYVKSLSFNNNLFYTSQSDGASFSILDKSLDFDKFKAAYGSDNIFANPVLNASFIPSSDSAAVNAARTSELCGAYDYRLNPRKVGALDIGALEKAS